MLWQLEMKLSQHNGAQPTPTAAASTLQTYNSNYRPNPAETSSYGISPLVRPHVSFSVYTSIYLLFLIHVLFLFLESGDYYIQNSGNGTHHWQHLQHVYYHVTDRP